MSEGQPKTPPPRIAQGGERNWLWAIVCAHLGLWLVLAAIIGNSTPRTFRDEEFSFVLLGITFAQSSLLGLWAALGTGVAVKRFASMLGLLGILLLACLGYFRLRDEPRALTALVVGISTLAPYFALQLLWILRRTLDLQIEAPISDTRVAEDARAQFSLGQSLVWIAAVALFLAIYRLLVPPADDFTLVWDFAFVPVLWLLCTIVDSVLVAGLCLMDYRTTRGRIVGAALLGLLVVSLVFEAKTTYWDSFFTLRGAELLLALVTLLALRLAGYRLRRVDREGIQAKA